MIVAKSDGYIVLPVRKALAVLELVAGNATGMPLASICRQLDLPKASGFRYLQTLVQSGFLAHDPATSTYSIGRKFRTLAEADSGLHRLRMVARPYLVTLASEFDETANLAIPLDGLVTYLDVVESSRTLRVQGRIGDRHPLHATALGKAMLSRMPEGVLQAELSRPLAARTSRTVLDIDLLRRQLRETERRGYAAETGENDEDASCVGAPIVDRTGLPVGAISISAPRQRLPRKMMPEVGRRLAETARAISMEVA